MSVKLTDEQISRLRAFAHTTHELHEQSRGLGRAQDTCVEYRQRMTDKRQRIEHELQHRPRAWTADSKPTAEEGRIIDELQDELERINARVAETDAELASIAEKREALAAVIGPRDRLVQRVLRAANLSRDDVGIAFDYGPRSIPADSTIQV